MKNLKDTINEASSSNYANNWQWFNILITNVNLELEQLEDMFSNLTDAEIKEWIKNIKVCYQGCEGENDANNIVTYRDLAEFYYNYPVTA